jgi:hypothetical protein
MVVGNNWLIEFRKEGSKKEDESEDEELNVASSSSEKTMGLSIIRMDFRDLLLEAIAYPPLILSFECVCVCSCMECRKGARRGGRGLMMEGRRCSVEQAVDGRKLRKHGGWRCCCWWKKTSQSQH